MKFRRTKIRTKSVRKLFPHADSVRVMKREVIDGVLVALVRTSEDGIFSSTILCAADVVWTLRGVRTPKGVLYIVRVARDTHSCCRKAKFAAATQEVIASNYLAQGKSSVDVASDLFERVRCGAYVGNHHPRVLYVQEVAAVLRAMHKEAGGVPDAPTYRPLDERKEHVETELRPYMLYCGGKIEHCAWVIRADGTTEGPPVLSDEEILRVAYFVDTLAIVHQLIERRIVALNGMVLIPPPVSCGGEQQIGVLSEGDLRLVGSLRAEGLLFQVQRRQNNRATACVFETAADGTSGLIASIDLHLIFGARFGVDVEDLARFERMFERFISTGELVDC